MKKVLLLVCLLAGGMAGLRAQPIPLYENYGNVTFSQIPPQIDALAFANYGNFNIFTPSLLPFDFQNTLYFTNRGSMVGDYGLQFDTAYSEGSRKPALNFENQRGGTISGSPWLSVDADRILSEGLLSASATGLIRLKGKDVNLSRSGVQIQPVSGLGFSFVTLSNFFPDNGIFDLYWGGITNQDMDAGELVQVIPNFGTIVQTPFHVVTNSDGSISGTAFGLVNPTLVAVFTNEISSTNWLVQAAFVDISDTNYSARVRFAPSQIPTNDFQTIVVELSMTDTNIVTGNVSPLNLYFTDRLASDTNYVMLTNLATQVTFRPAVYELSRSAPADFFNGRSGNTELTEELFYNDTYDSQFVTNTFAAYAAEISGGTAAVLPLPGASITNVAGRVAIEADALDLRRTRIRGNGLVSIETDHLVSSEGALVDCGDLRFRLASTNGILRLKDLSKDSVVRMNGALRAWSGVWSNSYPIVEMVETNEVTNTVIVGFHALVLDADPLVSSQQVQVHDVTLSSTNVFIDDNLFVTGTFVVNAEALTIDSELTLSGAIRDWSAATVPGLLYLTNLGSISVPNTAAFGNDRVAPYQSIVNRGSISASTHWYRSEYFENAGTIASQGPITLQTRSGKLEGGRTSSSRDVRFGAFDLKLHQYTNSSGGRLVLNATNSLADTGGGAGVLFNCTDGFELARKPFRGDLLGTTFQTTAPQFASVSHVWSAEDRGVAPAGFQDNAAIGQLTLSAGAFGELRFRGLTPGSANGLYVDVLTLNGALLSAFNANDLGSALTIDPGLTIYFAYANVPAEELDGMLDGRLRWVRDFAGPVSGRDLALPSGRVIRVNRALLESHTIDSDGDGLVNAIDPVPFAEPELTVGLLTVDPQVALLSWAAAPLTDYIVEYSNDPMTGEWQVLGAASNPTDRVMVLSVEDQDGGEANRYYRLRYEP
jgi:hypothetical protein